MNLKSDNAKLRIGLFTNGLKFASGAEKVVFSISLLSSDAKTEERKGLSWFLTLRQKSSVKGR